LLNNNVIVVEQTNVIVVEQTMFVVQVPSWVEARSSVSPPKTRSMSVVSSENTPGVDELL